MNHVIGFGGAMHPAAAMPFPTLRVRAYELREGSISWGLWTAASKAEAVELLREHVRSNPERYVGAPGRNVEAVECN